MPVIARRDRRRRIATASATSPSSAKASLPPLPCFVPPGCATAQFPPPAELQGLMERVGFTGCGYRLLTGGIAAIHWGAT